MSSVSLIPTTSTLLLSRLGEGFDSGVWSEFCTRYLRVVRAFALGLGLGEADADDVAQQVMAEVLRQFKEGKYDRARGRLRAWIFGIARKRAADVVRARAHRAEGGDGALALVEDDVRVTREWEAVENKELAREAMGVLIAEGGFEPATIRAFQRYTLDGIDAGIVAAECGVARAQVYMAKHRVLKRLAEVVERLQQDPEETDGRVPRS